MPRMIGTNRFWIDVKIQWRVFRRNPIRLPLAILLLITGCIPLLVIEMLHAFGSRYGIYVFGHVTDTLQRLFDKAFEHVFMDTAHGTFLKTLID